jgi:uncharacterized Zn finger protein
MAILACMTVDENWSHFFKPEVRKQGFDYFQNDDVFLQIASDTQILAFVKGSSRIKVHLTTESIASTSFNADCSCSSSGKGQLCKHIWATLLAVEKKHPDFLDSKKEVHKISQMKPQSRPLHAPSPEQLEKKEKFKAQQSDYRKEQYQKLKQKKKDQRKGSTQQAATLPENVQIALQFFSENGFPLSTPMSPVDIGNARKILARVFHPDKGGTHAEALLLNENYDILMEWASRQ